MQERNLLKWVPGAPGHYEVWYFKLNLGERAPALWLRLTILINNEGEKNIAETWGIFFDPAFDPLRHIAVKEVYPIEQFSADSDAIKIGPCIWKDAHTQGVIRSGGHEIRWEFDFEPNANSFDHVPRMFKALKLNKASVVTPNPDLKFTGSFWIDGHLYRAEKAPGMQGHIFGKKNALGWAWGHANRADDGTPFVFEGLTARIKLGGLVTSPPISAFYFEYNGTRYEFNTMKDALGIWSKYSLEGWEFVAKRGDLTFAGEIESNLQDFAGVRYEDTDGSFLYCHNSKVSSLYLRVFRNDVLEKEIISSRTCAFEVVSREHDTRVKVLI